MIKVPTVLTKIFNLIFSIQLSIKFNRTLINWPSQFSTNLPLPIEVDVGLGIGPRVLELLQRRGLLDLLSELDPEHPLELGVARFGAGGSVDAAGEAVAKDHPLLPEVILVQC